MIDTSRSPYVVSASVRGIGVAVITSTSGCSPFARSVARCSTPNRCCSSMTTSPSSLKRDVVLDQRMRADDQVDRAARELRLQLAALPRAAWLPVSSATRKRDVLQQPADRDEVLLGQDFGRRHERHLQAVFHRDQRRQQRDDRLAAADVPLQQPVHRLRPLHVLDDLLERLLLIRRSA